MARADIARIAPRSFAFTLFAALITAQAAWAGINPQPFRTGLFAVAAGQPIRISIVNTGAARSVIDPCFRVWSADGILLVETDVGPLRGGTGTTIEVLPVPEDGAPSGTPSRGSQLVRVEIAPIPEDGEPIPDDGLLLLVKTLRSVIPTVEVLDAISGSTAYTVPFVAVAGIEPQPFLPVAGIDPTPFRTGLFSVASGQAVRIAALNAGSAQGIIEPCFRVFNAVGALLLDADAGPLPGGVGTSIEFEPVPEDGTPSRGRALIRVEVTPVPEDGQPVPEDGLPARRRFFRSVIPTLEVFDLATGNTIYTLPFVKVAFNPQPEPPIPVRSPE